MLPTFDIGPQILDARLVQHVRADLVSPADIGLAVFYCLLLVIALAQFRFVQARFQHGHRVRAITVLRAAALALHHDTRGIMGYPDRRVRFIDVLATRTGCAESVDAQIRGVDFYFDGLIHLGINEHAGKGGMAAITGIERGFSHQPVNAGFCAKIAIGIIA